MSAERKLADVLARNFVRHSWGWKEGGETNGGRGRFEVYKPDSEGGAMVCWFDASEDRERAAQNASDMCDELNGRKPPTIPRQLALL